jgi:hypothetical protein
MTVVRFRLVSLTALAAALAGAFSCRPGPASIAGLDAATASAIPADTELLSSLDLARIRGSPLVPALPANARQFLASYPTASSLVVAWKSDAFLILARGAFTQPPAGSVLVNSGLVMAGPENALQAAIARYNSRALPRSPVLDYAARSFPDAPVWAAARGGVALPLTGNAANLNRLLRDLDYAGLALTVDSPAQLRLVALGASSDGARRFEESFRAFLSLAAAGEARHPDLAALLGAARVERQDRAVAVTLQAPIDRIALLLTALAR